MEREEVEKLISDKLEPLAQKVTELTEAMMEVVKMTEESSNVVRGVSNTINTILEHANKNKD